MGLISGLLLSQSGLYINSSNGTSAGNVSVVVTANGGSATATGGAATATGGSNTNTDNDTNTATNMTGRRFRSSLERILKTLMKTFIHWRINKN